MLRLFAFDVTDKGSRFAPISSTFADGGMPNVC
jgi:hypothetical protein